MATPAPRRGIDMTVYAEGVRHAIELCTLPDGKYDGNHYTEALYGLARAMTAAGREVSVDLLSRRWHDPLARANETDVKDPYLPRYGGPSLIEQMEGSLKDFVTRGGLYGTGEPFEVRNLRERRHDTWRLSRASDAVHRFQSEVLIEREAEVLIDSEIKRAHPKTRRNSKAYKVLADSVRDKAHQIIREEKRKAAYAELAEAEKWYALDDGYVHSSGHAKDRARVMGYVKGWRECASDVLCLLPDSPWPAKVEERVAEVEALWVAHDMSVTAEMERLRAALSE